MSKLDEINDSLADFEKELSKLKSASSLIEDAKDSTQTILSESKKLNKSAQNLLDAVNILMKKLDKVDFPTRLDKLDTTVSGLVTTMQSVFNRFDSIEQNIKYDLSSKINLSEQNINKEFYSKTSQLNNNIKEAQKSILSEIKYLENNYNAKIDSLTIKLSKSQKLNLTLLILLFLFTGGTVIILLLKFL